jgi:hypothetical protein
MAKTKNRPGREPRKSRSITGPLMLDARGELIPRDDSPAEVWLCIHRESDTGKAWLVSIDGRYASGVWVPKSMITIGEPCGGFQVWQATRLVRNAVHLCMLPAYMAMEKGLIPKANAKVAERVA